MRTGGVKSATRIATKFEGAFMSDDNIPLLRNATIAVVLIGAMAFFFSGEPQPNTSTVAASTPPPKAAPAPKQAARPPVAALKQQEPEAPETHIPEEVLRAVGSALPRAATSAQVTAYAKFFMQRAQDGEKISTRALGRWFDQPTLPGPPQPCQWLVHGELQEEMEARLNKYMDRFAHLNLATNDVSGFWIEEMLPILNKYPDWDVLYLYSQERYYERTSLSLPRWVQLKMQGAELPSSTPEEKKDAAVFRTLAQENELERLKKLQEYRESKMIRVR